MIEKIAKIVEKIILPKYPEIIDVIVEIKFIDGDVYIVNYSLNEELSNVRKIDLIGDTRTLLKMISVDKAVVDFEIRPPRMKN